MYDAKNYTCEQVSVKQVKFVTVLPDIATLNTCYLLDVAHALFDSNFCTASINPSISGFAT